MSGERVHFSQFGGRTTAGETAAPGREFQELWFSLARKRWSSVVLVPADGGGSTARFATSLADVGGRLRDTPVTAIVADAIDYESVRMLTDLQLRVTDTRRTDAIEVEAQIVSVSSEVRYPEPGAPVAPSPVREATALPPVGQIIVAIPPVVVEPLGVAIAHAADAVILCVEMGRTRLKSARRTIDLIGADRITGAFLIR
jgi:hypothetical protein